MSETTSFMIVPARNPINEPHADRSALFMSLSGNAFSDQCSDKRAEMIPKGGKRNIPKTIPTADPQTPYFVPPYFFVPQTGT